MQAARGGPRRPPGPLAGQRRLAAQGLLAAHNRLAGRSRPVERSRLVLEVRGAPVRRPLAPLHLGEALAPPPAGLRLVALPPNPRPSGGTWPETAR